MCIPGQSLKSCHCEHLVTSDAWQLRGWTSQTASTNQTRRTVTTTICRGQVQVGSAFAPVPVNSAALIFAQMPSLPQTFYRGLLAHIALLLACFRLLNCTPRKRGFLCLQKIRDMGKGQAPALEGSPRLHRTHFWWWTLFTSEGPFLMINALKLVLVHAHFDKH